MIKEKYDVYPRAFKEVREIISFFPKSEYRKIPKTFINFIEENMDRNYEYTVEHVDDFQNQKMLKETKAILSIIYKDFIASSNVKKEICQFEKLELLQEEKVKEECNLESLLKNENSKIGPIEDSVAIVERKNSKFEKIKIWFKRASKKILIKM